MARIAKYKKEKGKNIKCVALKMLKALETLYHRCLLQIKEDKLLLAVNVQYLIISTLIFIVKIFMNIYIAYIIKV